MRKALATFVLALLVSALAGTLLVRVGLANPSLMFPSNPYVPPPNPAAINIFLNPQNNTSYDGNSVSLRVSVTNLSDVYSISCYLDGEQINKPRGTAFALYLTDLSEGAHTIRVSVSNQKLLNWVWKDPFSSPPWSPVYFTANSYIVYSDSEVYFTFDNVSPLVSVLSPQERTYDVPDVPLDFIVDESLLQVVYCLDGDDNVTVSGDTTLTGLSNGEHNMTVYAWDEAGNIGASEPMFFSVAEAEPEAFPSVLVAVVVVVAVVCVFVGAYFAKFRKRSEA